MRLLSLYYEECPATNSGITARSLPVVTRAVQHSCYFWFVGLVHRQEKPCPWSVQVGSVPNWNTKFLSHCRMPPLQRMKEEYDARPCRFGDFVQLRGGGTYVHVPHTVFPFHCKGRTHRTELLLHRAYRRGCHDQKCCGMHTNHRRLRSG